MNHVIYPTTDLKHTESLIIDRGEGIYVFDNNGKRYLEGMSGLWCTSLGYGNKEVIETSKEQMEKLAFSHMFGGKSHQPGIDLANALSDMVPVKDAKIFFGNSGSDANDTQIKMLRYYFNAIGKPEKRKIISRERAYHGVTVAASCLTSLPANIAFFDPPVEAIGALKTAHPHYYHGGLAGESEDQFVDRILLELEAQIQAENPDTIAAFIAEPITGASGVIVPPEGYYQKLQVLLNKYNILFWADEVITGFGRTGNDFGCTTMGIDSPSMMSFAKQLSSAYFPISAAVIEGDMYDAFVDQSSKVGVFGHGYTYSGHPVGCAISLKVLEICQRDQLFKQAAINGTYLQKSLMSLKEHPLVGDIRGKGLLAAVELMENKAQKISFEGGKIGAYAAQQCQKMGLIVRPVAGNSLAMCPPLIINQAQIDEMITILTKALDATLDFANQERLLK